MKTDVLLDHEPVADGGYLVRALLRITGEAPEAAERPRLNLAVVLDRSGSMGALGKLERAKEAAGLLVRRVGDEDVVSVVAYSEGNGYAVGFCHQRREPRVFRIDCMMEAELLDDRFDAPAAFEPADCRRCGRWCGRPRNERARALGRR